MCNHEFKMFHQVGDKITHFIHDSNSFSNVFD